MARGMLRGTVPARMLIAALSLGALLVGAYLATSFVVMFYAAKELPRSLAQGKAPAPSRTPVPAAILNAPLHPATTQSALETAASDSTQAREERALQAATQRDPDIAALVNDSDPRVRGAILDFFAAPRSNQAPDR